MRTPRRAARLAAVPAAVSLAAALTMAAGPGLAAAATRTSAASPGIHTTGKLTAPTIKLTAAQKDITVFSFRHHVFFDPGIWVSSLNAPLVFHVQRSSYTT